MNNYEDWSSVPTCVLDHDQIFLTPLKGPCFLAALFLPSYTHCPEVIPASMQSSAWTWNHYICFPHSVWEGVQDQSTSMFLRLKTSTHVRDVCPIMGPHNCSLQFPPGGRCMQFCTGISSDWIPAQDNHPEALLVRSRQETKILNWEHFLKQKCFRALKIIFAAAQQWKVGHTNIFSKHLSTFSLLLSPLETEKNSQTFSVSLVANCPPPVDLILCLTMELQLHLFLFSNEYFLTSNTFGRRAWCQAGSGGSTCLRCMETGHIPLCPKEAKEGLKVWCGRGYGVVLFELLSVSSQLPPEMPSHVWEMLFVNQPLLMKTYFSPQISSQPSHGHVWYQIANPGVGFSFSLQPDRKILFE